MTEKNKEIVRQFYELVVNTGNLDLVEEYVSDQFREVYDGITTDSGIEGAKYLVIGIRSTYKDLNIKITRQYAEGDAIISQYTMVATHAGRWRGIRPSGKQITVTGVNIDRVENGKIVEHEGTANLFEPMLATGSVVPAH